MAQCFDHLITSNSGYLPIIDDVLKGQKKSSVWQKLPLLPGLWGQILIKSLDPAQTRKMKAPKRFQPAQSDVSGSIIHDFAGQQEQITKNQSDREPRPRADRNYFSGSKSHHLQLDGRLPDHSCARTKTLSTGATRHRRDRVSDHVLTSN